MVTIAHDQCGGAIEGLRNACSSSPTDHVEAFEPHVPGRVQHNV